MMRASKETNCFSISGANCGVEGQVLDLPVLALPGTDCWLRMQQLEESDFAKLACKEEGEMKVKGST